MLELLSGVLQPNAGELGVRIKRKDFFEFQSGGGPIAGFDSCLRFRAQSFDVPPNFI
ncbi:MAG: hypothetical protein ACE5FI_02775 [Anaerolineales bacterium]